MALYDNKDAYDTLLKYGTKTLGVSFNRLERINGDIYAEGNITYDSTAAKQYTDATCMKMANDMYYITVRKNLKPYTTQYLYAYELEQLWSD